MGLRDVCREFPRVVVLLVGGGLYWSLKRWTIKPQELSAEALAAKRREAKHLADHWMVATGIAWPLLAIGGGIAGYDLKSPPWWLILSAPAIGVLWALGYNLSRTRSAGDVAKKRPGDGR